MHTVDSFLTDGRRPRPRPEWTAPKCFLDDAHGPRAQDTVALVHGTVIHAPFARINGLAMGLPEPLFNFSSAATGPARTVPTGGTKRCLFEMVYGRNTEPRVAPLALLLSLALVWSPGFGGAPPDKRNRCANSRKTIRETGPGHGKKNVTGFAISATTRKTSALLS